MRKSRTKEVSASRARTPKIARRYWWLMLQGLCALVFGILAIFWPNLTLSLFLYVFGVYAIIEGLPTLWHAIFAKKTEQKGSRGMLFIEGAISVVAGILCLVLPHTHSRLLLYIIAAWLLLKGVCFLMQIRTRGWQTALVGVLSVLIGIFLFFAITISVRLILLLIGIFALIMGIVLIGRGWRARAVRRAELSAAG